MGSSVSELELPAASETAVSNSAHAPVSPVARPRKSFLRRMLFPVGMLAAAFGVFWLVAGHALTRRDVEQLPPDETTTHDPHVVSVTVAPVVMRPVRRTVEAVGTLYGYEEVSIRAKVEGRVKRVLHDVADRVAPGEPIIELDPADAELAVRQAEKNLQTELARLGLTAPPSSNFDVNQVPVVMQAKVRLDNAKGKLDRSTALAQKLVITSDQLAERTTEFRAAEAELANQVLIANAGLATIQMRQESLAIAQKELDDTVVLAPFPSKPVPGIDGAIYAVTKREVSEGTFVRVADEVCRLVIDKTLKLRVAVPERNSAEVALGQKADVFVNSSIAVPFQGEVSRINPSVDQTTRTFEVEVLLANNEGKLKPGGFAKAAIATRQDDQAATVPLEALVTFAGITKIFVTEGDKVREVRVTLGVQHPEWVEIATPKLSPGAQVVTSGQTALAEGSTVFTRASTDAARTAKQPASAESANSSTERRFQKQPPMHRLARRRVYR